jgi:hypothetical protein
MSDKFSELQYEVRFMYEKSLSQMVSDLDKIGKEHKVKVDIDVDLNKVQEINKAKEAMKGFTKGTEKQESAIKALQRQVKEYKEQLAVLHGEARTSGQATEENIRQQQSLGQSIHEVGLQIRSVNRGFVDSETVLNKEAETISELKAQYAALKAQRDSLPRSSPVFEEVTRRAAETNAQLKELEATIGVNTRSVGDYTNSIRAAANALAVFQGPLGPIAGRVNSFATVLNRMFGSVQVGQKRFMGLRNVMAGTIPLINRSAGANAAKTASIIALNTATRAYNATLRLLRAAIIATGIGALIVSVVALVSWFRRTEEGAQKLRVIMAQFRAVIDVFRDRSSALGKTIMEAFENPQQAVKDLWEVIKQNIVNRFIALPKLFTSAFSVLRSGAKGARQIGRAHV